MWNANQTSFGNGTLQGYVNASYGTLQAAAKNSYDAGDLLGFRTCWVVSYPGGLCSGCASAHVLWVVLSHSGPDLRSQPSCALACADSRPLAVWIGDTAQVQQVGDGLGFVLSTWSQVRVCL